MEEKSAVFADFSDVFGNASAEWDANACVAAPGSGALAAGLPDVASLGRFFFGAHAIDAARVQLVVSNFRLFTWERTLNFRQLEELISEAGVTGQPSDFCEYLRKSISGELKLVLGGLLAQNMSSSIIHAKLMARMTTETYQIPMPAVTVIMNRLTGPPAQHAMLNLHAALYREFQENKREFCKEQLWCVDLTNKLSEAKRRTEELRVMNEDHKRQNQDLKKQIMDLKKLFDDSKKLNIVATMASTKEDMPCNPNPPKLMKTKHISANGNGNIKPLIGKDFNYVSTGQHLGIVYQRKGR